MKLKRSVGTSIVVVVDILLEAMEKEFNLRIDTIELEHEHIHEEAQAAVDAGEDQERRAW